MTDFDFDLDVDLDPNAPPTAPALGQVPLLTKAPTNNLKTTCTP
jgi:hypothetical protein